jgi:flagellar motor switch protein FliN/FliY
MSDPIAAVRTAAAAAAATLPLPAAPTVGAPQTAQAAAADVFALLPTGATTVVRASWNPTAGTTASGAVAVVVGSALTEALATSPMGPLDPAAAVQPVLDAVAAAFGATAATATSADINDALPPLLEQDDAFFVPLTDAEGWVCATLVLVLPATGPGFAPDPVAAPMAAAAEGGGPAVATATAVGAGAIPRQATGARPAVPSGSGLELLREVVLEVTVELGRTRMPIAQLLSLAPGAVVELDRAAGSPADLLVNGTLIARGEVVVVDEDFGIRITEIVAPSSPVNEFLTSRQGGS